MDGNVHSRSRLSKTNLSNRPWLPSSTRSTRKIFSASRTVFARGAASINRWMRGKSESLTVNGNVTYFQITNDLVHDNDNIGIDAIGYEGVGPVGYDEAMYGEISGNTVYNISGITNPGEGYEYDADGLYCDGCAYVTIERNVIIQTDYGIETTSENQICQTNGTEWSGPNSTGTAGKGKSPCYGRYVTVRNNIFYNSNACGNSIRSEEHT